MHKLRLTLSTLLVLQLVVAGGLYWHAQSDRGGFEQKSLLAFDKDNIDRLVISSADARVTLHKNNGSWQLPEAQGLPVNQTKLDKVLTTFAQLKTNWPVSTTTSSHARFEVSDDNYQRRIQLYQGDKLSGELLLGSSPGFKKSHVRLPGDDNVYALALNVYDFAPDSNDWLDKMLLSVKEVTAIKGTQFSLSKTDEQWQLAKPQGADVGEESLDQDKAQQLAQAVMSLRVSGVADKVPAVEAATTVELELANGQRLAYQFFEHDNKYFVKRGDRETVFTVSQYDYDRIAGAELSGLLQAPKEKQADVSDSPQTGSAKG